MQKYYVTDYGVKTDCADLQTTAFQKVFLTFCPKSSKIYLFTIMEIS